MERCQTHDNKLWEKTRERTVSEMLAIREASWNADVPEEALPYIHNVVTPDELKDLAQALKECMPLMAYIQALTELKRAYGRDFDASGIRTRPSLEAVG